ncbi:hypothetical protein MTR67_043438 [Solanum verrucosum]|uniref:Uncharacterized protein n=1 Tax=Solanum verrucosum TaxID=315347 RepID=A0AAF0URC3_SOLVR|nr:hypothetical protein MTR67_043438 [Solanum verrucosum]
MAKIMNQMDLLMKHVTGGCYKAVNVVGASNGMIPNDSQFETMYNKEVRFLSNQVRERGFSFELSKATQKSRLEKRS